MTAKDIRNVCLLGHGSSGKSSLAEAILFYTKNSDRFGKIPDGNTVSDYDPEEIKRLYSIQTSILTFNYNNTKINLIDTPGFFDFIGEVKEGARVADSALILVDAKNGVDVGTEFGADYAKEANIPMSFFINKTDDEDVNFSNIFNGLKESFGVSVCPVMIPHVEDHKTVGYADLIKMKYLVFDKNGTVKESDIPASFMDSATEYKAMLSESLAETSEALMEKFFGEEEFTLEETKNALKEGIKSKSVSPVFSGAATSLAGVEYILNAIAEYYPNPLDKVNEHIEDEDKVADIKIKEDGNCAIFVFKTVADQFGKMSYFKVMNGVLKRDTVLKNLTTENNEKIAHIYTLRGKKQTEVDELCCGDIGMTTKLTATNTNDTLSASDKSVYKKIQFPRPFLTNAVLPKSKGDEDKISSSIQKLLEEDLTIKYEINSETRQMLLAGLGEIHIDVITSKLKNRFGITVELSVPRMAYREAIKKKIQVEGKHKKQSGGHGQYGHVKIEFSPGEEPGLTFTESIFGGSVPKSFHPAVEKGLQECILRGVLAGYPMANLKANLYDGSYHDVDSNELSFKLAAAIAYKELVKASPVLLEPVGELKVYIPESMVGDVIGDLNKRRGRVMGINASEDKKGYSVVEAEVPTAEMQTYTVQLRSMTQGRGRYEFNFIRYDEVPSSISPKIIEEAKKLQAEEE